MFDVNFSFTREPSIKISVQIISAGLVPSDNTTVMIGQVSVAGGTATEDVPVTIANAGDLVALQAEVDGLFGAGSIIGEMVIANATAVLQTDLDPLLQPPIIALPIANASTDITAVLAANSTLPMPFVAIEQPMTDATNKDALQNHLVSISKSDRGVNAQFGSFGFSASDASLATVTPVAEGTARQEMVLPWLYDTAGTKKNKVHEVAAAVCALVAANILPFNPVNGAKVGGLEAPEDTADYATPGDAGTVSSSLAAGLTPLTISSSGSVLIPRSITASRRVAGIPDSDYFDIQDWQVLYFLRKNIFNIASKKTFKQAKASAQKVAALRSGIIALLRVGENLGMLQFVEQLADQVTVKQDPTNRSAYIYTVPVNVIPGFHNKGIGLIGTTLFDGTVVA